MKLIWTVWLIVISTFGPLFANVVSASVSKHFPPILLSTAYDVRVRPRTTYDAALVSAFDYDCGPILLAEEKQNCSQGTGALFGEFAKLFAAEETAAGSKALVPYYPPNQGFAGASGEASLVPGTVVDRYGGTGGSFLSPQGTPAAARSLPFGVETRPLNSYQVMQPINVNAGTAAPWFNQPGGGLQFDLGTTTVQDLINSGHLKPIP